MLLVSYLISHHLIQGNEDLSLHFLLNFMVLVLTFRSLIQLEFFVCDMN